MFLYDVKGIKLNKTNLWLDAHRNTDFSFVSHGHSDHLKNHKKILATPATIRFHAMRARQKEIIPLDYETAYELDDMRICLYPAGHILGSAMIYVERRNISLLYTGDFKLQPSATCEAITIPRADYLIMESTFGHPEYVVNKSRETLIDEIVFFIHDCVKKNFTPVIMGYSLGKAQEAMKILGDLGYHVLVHQSAWRFASVYNEYGIQFPNCEPWGEQSVEPGDVLIIPPHLMGLRKLKNLPSRFKSVFLSGWANSATGARFGCDHCIALSDHADFQELLHFIKAVNPQKVFTTHGDINFPDYIRDIGYEAELLQLQSQVILE
ncbi:MAG TPA: MBL fold metallo-hydrolase RNA specificity domain-containing protein [bacterium]|nr:MBL fold metallo-hydrolase RNA specificity domain-containing protein [bacterium]HPN42082.1 MBL fold metallo-hydrolase RNA specificity domain-containing protein [bacterium]